MNPNPHSGTSVVKYLEAAGYHTNIPACARVGLLRSVPPMRYAETLPLPAYRYVPAQQPHPMSHPHGHRMAGITLGTDAFDPHAWRQSITYCYGLDLFNLGYYWEAHETWERLWQQAGRAGATADFLKGLIKLAAALVKACEGRAVGVRRHAARAKELLLTVTAQDTPAYCLGGLNLRELAQMADQIGVQADRLASGQVVAPFADYQLVPGTKSAGHE